MASREEDDEGLSVTEDKAKPCGSEASEPAITVMAKVMDQDFSDTAWKE